MSDDVWGIVLGVLLVLLGILFIWLGLSIWKKQKIELIIRHHMDKVSDEDRQAYCRLCGIGVLIIGFGFVVSGIWMTFTIELLSWIPMTVGLVAGLVLLAVSVARYNH